MALEQSRFFDSVGGDKKYTAEQFAEYFRAFMTNGIKNGGSNLQVTAPGTGMDITIDYGIGLIEGYMYWLKDDAEGKLTLTVGASGALPRIDRVVLRLDKSLPERSISAQLLSGAPAAAPVPPTLTRGGNIFEISLAQINIRANTNTVLPSDVKEERYNTDVCGLINSLISLDSSDFAAQAEAILDQMANQGYLPVSEVVTAPAAGKVLRLNASSKLPASITGDAATLQGYTAEQVALLKGPQVVLTRTDPTPTAETTIYLKY
mgnify:CR=1 FL=1|jgi:hypothetical protein